MQILQCRCLPFELQTGEIGKEKCLKGQRGVGGLRQPTKEEPSALSEEQPKNISRYPLIGKQGVGGNGSRANEGP